MATASAGIIATIQTRHLDEYGEKDAPVWEQVAAREGFGKRFRVAKPRLRAKFTRARCVAVCPAGEDVIGPYLASKKDFADDVLRPLPKWLLALNAAFHRESQQRPESLEHRNMKALVFKRYGRLDQVTFADIPSR